MKYSVSFITLLASVVSALPAELEVRQSNRVGSTANEFKNNGCADVVFVFARGSTEIGNMGTICGPPTAEGLKQAFGAGNVAVQGVDYAAALSTNFLPGGADPAGIREMTSLINQVTSQCADSTLLVGGYSQGAAVVHRAVEDLPAATSSKIAGIVTFGDTQNQQDNRQVPNFDPAKTKIICARGDLVCVGTLTITAAHLGYGSDAREASAFLVQMARNAGAGGAGAGAGAGAGTGSGTGRTRTGRN